MEDRDFDIKNGNWFPIMHQMADKLMTYRLSGTEYQVFFMFMRFCYGYQNSTCELRWKDMLEFTDLSKGSLSKAISKLKERNILRSFQKETKTGISYKINSKISTWKRISKRKMVSKRKLNGFQKETIPIKDNNKDKESTANADILKKINDLAETLYQQKRFPKVHAFKNKILKDKQNANALYHALTRLQIATKIQAESAWAYCAKIMQVENGNYNEQEFQQRVEKQKRELEKWEQEQTIIR